MAAPSRAPQSGLSQWGDRKRLQESIRRFEAWLERTGYESFDPYDIWGTKYGVFARSVYYRKGVVGLPLIAPIVLLELVCPSLRRYFVRKERFATADAQLLLAFLNLHTPSTGSTRVPRVPSGAPPDDSSNSNSLSASNPFSAADGEKVAAGRMRCPPASESLGNGEVSKSFDRSVLNALDPQNAKPDTRNPKRESPASGSTGVPTGATLSALRGGRGAGGEVGDVPNPSVMGSTGASPVPACVSPGDSSNYRQNSAVPNRTPPSTLNALNSQPARNSKLETRNFLQDARALAEDLLRYSIPGYSGHCWGYPFDWQNNRGLWRKNTPYITCTPYCFEAFVALYEATQDMRYLEVAQSIAKFVCLDLKDTPAGPGAAAASYSPFDETKVINASAYRAWVLFEAAHRFDLPEYRTKAQSNLNFILQSQREDGSWLYALESRGEAFIDHFHTCFVLKNLVKLNRRLRSDAVSQAILRGYQYYRRELFDSDGLPKSFSIQPRTQLVRIEMYNFAEAITLGVLLREQIPSAFDDAMRLASVLMENYQLPAGYFATRVYIGGGLHTHPFIRWPQAQLFYALTNLLLALSQPSNLSGGEFPES